MDKEIKFEYELNCNLQAPFDNTYNQQLEKYIRYDNHHINEWVIEHITSIICEPDDCDWDNTGYIRLVTDVELSPQQLIILRDELMKFEDPAIDISDKDEFQLVSKPDLA